MEFPQIKKIGFKFSNLMHSALVSISGTRDETFVYIHLINSFMKKYSEWNESGFPIARAKLKSGVQTSFFYQMAQIVTSQIKEDLKEKNASTLRVVNSIFGFLFQCPPQRQQLKNHLIPHPLCFHQATILLLLILWILFSFFLFFHK